jgi:septum site-determining protein MinD
VEERRGSIFVVSSGKGGTGKSVFSANLALALRQETKDTVALLDMNAEYCGDAAHSLGLSPYVDQASTSGISPKKGMIDLIYNINAITPRALLASIPPSATGVSVFNLKGIGEEKREVPYKNVGPFIDVVSRCYGLVVIDLCTGYTEQVNRICMERANAIFILLHPELLDIFNSIRACTSLQQMMFPQQMIYPVLNRYSPKNDFSPSVIETKITRNIFASIPEDEAFFSTALRLNKAAIDLHPNHAVSRAFASIAAKLWSMDLCAPKKSGSDVSPSADSEGQGQPEPSVSEKESTRKTAETTGEYDEIKKLIHRKLFEELDLKALDEKAVRDEQANQQIRRKIKAVIDRLVDEEAPGFIDRSTRLVISREILDEALGLGPLEDLLQDESITEIMCNGPDQIFIEKQGLIEQCNRRFLDEKYLRATVDRIVMRVGRRIDELSPMVDARLLDGSRVNAVIPPLSPDGCLLTIRKFSKEPLSIEDLIYFGSLNQQMADLLKLCVEARLNILVSGGTGSGKTTLLNVLSSFIPANERIVTIEDSTELKLQQEHVCRLEGRPENIEGQGEVTIRDLVRNALRMRPDRIIVGECRGSEAVDMLQAMNTGHDGSMTTVHANSVKDSIRRLETLVMFAGLELPSRAIKEQIASAINIVIQQDRQLDGSRKIVKISEITEMEGDVITTQEIFSFQQTGRDDAGNIVGNFMASGLIPNFIADLEERGFDVPRDIFM